MLIREDDPPRWRLIVRWLEEHKAEIVEADKGRLVINYAGCDGLSFEISRKEEAVTEN